MLAGADGTVYEIIIRTIKTISGVIFLNHHQNPEKHKTRKFIMKELGHAFLAAVIFLSGFGLGSGRIILNSDQLFQKTVQKDLPADLDYASVEDVYDALRKDFDGQLDNKKLLDGLKVGLANASGDPYTEYLNAEQAKEFDNQLNGTFVGIGAELSKDEQGNIVIISPISGFPAEKAGLKPKDIIIEINDKPATGIGVSEAVKQIRGEENTKVKLKVVRDKAKELTFEITRVKIVIPSVTSKVLDGNIGYIKIARYAEDTVELTTKFAQELKDKNVKGIILDVRNDPGGLLDASVKVSSLWLNPGDMILEEKRDTLVVKRYKAVGEPILRGIPTVVLINEGSASASEITAGALRDNKAAKLIGVKTYGKGSVQQLEKFGDGSVLKVTIARWYTPAGVNINKEGIKPDTEVKLDEEKFKAGTDNQLGEALKVLR